MPGRLFDCGAISVTDLLSAPRTLFTPAAGRYVDGLLSVAEDISAGGWAIVVQEEGVETAPGESLCARTHGTFPASRPLIASGAAIVAYAATAQNGWRVRGPIPAWQPNTPYTVTSQLSGDLIADDAGNVWSVAVGGTSGSELPDFASQDGNAGATMTDGDDVIWVNEGAYPTEGVVRVCLAVLSVRAFPSQAIVGTGPLPSVASATCILSLQADALALSHAAPVSVWPDASGRRHHFTSSGAARPTYLADGGDGLPAVAFDGVDDYLEGPDIAGSGSFTIFAVALTPDAFSYIVTKIADWAHSGWLLGQGGQEFYVQGAGGSDWISSDLADAPTNAWHLLTAECVSEAEIHLAVDADQSGETVSSSETPFTLDSSDPIRLAIQDITEPLSFRAISLRALMIYAPAPSAEDRAAIETWLAGKYGIPLG